MKNHKTLKINYKIYALKVDGWNIINKLKWQNFSWQCKPDDPEMVILKNFCKYLNVPPPNTIENKNKF